MSAAVPGTKVESKSISAATDQARSAGQKRFARWDCPAPTKTRGGPYPISDSGCRHVAMGELTMSKADRESFLQDPHVGVISVARDGEASLAVPVWYRYEPGGDVVFSFEAESEKIKLVQATGQASLCVQNEAMPYKYVTVEGPAVVGETDRELERSLAHRYLGAEIGDLDLQAIQGTVSRVVRLTPARWRTVDYAPMVERMLGASALSRRDPRSVLRPADLGPGRS